MSELIGKISKIASAPVKAGGLLEVRKALLTPGGIEVPVGNRRVRDHQFAVVRAEPDSDGVHHVVTQRDKRDKSEKKGQGLAVMSLITPQLAGDNLVLTWQGRDQIEVPQDMDRGKEIPVDIFDTTVRAVVQEAGLTEWLSDHLGTDVKLVKAAGTFSRLADQDYAPNDAQIGFQDGYPVHWFFDESVAELSQVAGEPISWQSFRPQIVAEGSPAQTEHLVYAGTVADVSFTDPKPCGRCPVTNVDQETGEVKVGRALTPLATYKRWRNQDGAVKVIFGENMLPEGSGEIAVGDEIVMTARRNPPLVYGAKV